jgi:hypothetical protein
MLFRMFSKDHKLVLVRDLILIRLCFEHSKPGKVEELRNLIAKAIVSDPINYNEATLQKSPEEYAKFMKQTNSWGGMMIFNIRESLKLEH